MPAYNVNADALLNGTPSRSRSSIWWVVPFCQTLVAGTHRYNTITIGPACQPEPGHRNGTGYASQKPRTHVDYLAGKIKRQKCWPGRIFPRGWLPCPARPCPAGPFFFVGVCLLACAPVLRRYIRHIAGDSGFNGGYSSIVHAAAWLTSPLPTLLSRRGRAGGRS